MSVNLTITSYGSLLIDHDRMYDLALRALDAWGRDSQIGMVAEECAELGAECCRVVRGRTDHQMAMIEEAADVYIVVTQLALIAPREFSAALDRKLARLEMLLQEAPRG